MALAMVVAVWVGLALTIIGLMACPPVAVLGVVIAVVGASYTKGKEVRHG